MTMWTPLQRIAVPPVTDADIEDCGLGLPDPAELKRRLEYEAAKYEYWSNDRYDVKARTEDGWTTLDVVMTSLGHIVLPDVSRIKLQLLGRDGVVTSVRLCGVKL
jgi:hypothetical protein